MTTLSAIWQANQLLPSFGRPPSNTNPCLGRNPSIISSGICIVVSSISVSASKLLGVAAAGRSARAPALTGVAGIERPSQVKAAPVARFSIRSERWRRPVVLKPAQCFSKVAMTSARAASMSALAPQSARYIAR